MTFTRSYDFALIRSVMTHPLLYDRAADDFAPPCDAFQPREDPEIWYVLATDGGELLGLFALAPQNAVCWEIHTRLLPHAWGERAADAARGIVPWVWANTTARRLVTMVPSYNRLAIRFAEHAGMSHYGLNPRSWQKHGKLYDQALLGVSAPEETTCQL